METKLQMLEILIGVTTNQAYLPVEKSFFFESDLSLVDWLRQWVRQRT
jgi:hypothetical protein